MRPDASQKIKSAAPKGGPNPVVIGAVVAVVLIVAVVAAILTATRTSSDSDAAGGSAGSAQPLGVTGGVGGGIVANPTTAKSNAPTLDLYEDFQCPACGQLEKLMGPDIALMADAGDIKLVVHTLSFLDNNLKNDSSKRSANGAACAADAGKVLQFHSAVFAGQPAQEGTGFTNGQLTGFAEQAGITGAALETWRTCASSGQHDQYVTDVQKTSEKAGVFGTPTVKLNGKDVTLTTVAALVAEVKAAAK